MPKDKPRTIYAHQSKLYRYYHEENQTAEEWKPEIIKTIFKHILSLSETERTMVDQRDEWLMYLDKVDIIPKSAFYPDECIQGVFYSSRDGLRTQLIDMNTLKKEDNQKKPGQNETRKTHFFIRLSDGLFLLDSYSDNVVTNMRVEAYMDIFAKQLLEDNKISRLSFETLLSQGFIDKLNNFEIITLAQLRVKMQANDEYEKTDALGHMQDEAKTIRASQIEIRIGKPKSKKEGMLIGPLTDLLKKYMNRSGIVSGTISGRPLPGKPPVLKLKGAEEKYPNRFEVDAEGEVLTEHMFGRMLEISRDRQKLILM